MRRTKLLFTLIAALGASACGGNESPGGLAEPSGSTPGKTTTTGGGETTTGGATDTPAPEPEKTVLDERVVDYSEALRTASLKLVRNVPTLQQIKNVSLATDKAAAYEAEIDAMFADPRFTTRMIKWWKDTMRQGGGAADNKPSRDTAPIFAARVTVEGRPYTDLFTATNGTCPGYDNDAKAFTDGNCNNNVPVHAGVLTNPGVMMQFNGNMAFRRVRWVQEIFVCTKFPAEYAPEPETMQSGNDYVSPWDFESVATSPVDFQDTQSVVCANCHTTINHIAPLFGNFDGNGQWTNNIQVMTPTVPDPVKTDLSHWLRPGETTSWRKGKAVADLPALGKAMAEDPDVTACAVARMWNFAMSKEDIVSDLATVPPEVLEPWIEEFKSNGMNLKQTLRAILLSNDFVSY
jgi:hypothetical protein